MKKSHRWEEQPVVVNIKCPHCGCWFRLEGNYIVGDIINCPQRHCLEDFELGHQK